MATTTTQLLAHGDFLKTYYLYTESLQARGYIATANQLTNIHTNGLKLLIRLSPTRHLVPVLLNVDSPRTVADVLFQGMVDP